MKIRYTLLLLLCLTQTSLWAQYNLKENNMWMFGYQAGLDFNSGTAIPIQSAMNNNSDYAALINASATLCDTSGQVLFYSSGDTIYNRNNEVMDNGDGLLSTDNSGGSNSVGGVGIQCATITYDTLVDTVAGVIDTTYDTISVLSAMGSMQGSLIMPVLSNPNQYYVFSLQQSCSGDPAAGRLYYCIVDMSLNNGLGGVLSNQKAILLDSALSEKMIAIPGDNCDMWLLAHGNLNDSFVAFNITEAGINPVPVTSGAGNIVGLWSYMIGEMQVSPDRQKIAIGSNGVLGVFGGLGAELCDFDPTTGIVSNPVTISSNGTFGVAFSPDNTKLYVDDETFDTSYNITGHISQYDITLSTASAIVASKVEVYAAPATLTALALAPDGKIYASADTNELSQYTNTLHVISDPNAAGSGCQFTPFAVTLDAGTYADYGLHNIYMKPIQDTTYTRTNTNLSFTGNLSLHAPSGYFNFLWNDGTTDSVDMVTDTGTYWVVCGNYCSYQTDTFVVRPPTGLAQVNGAVAATLTTYPSPARNTANVTISGLNKIDGTLQLIEYGRPHCAATGMQQQKTNIRCE